jgi:hypothetical protein
MVMAGRGKAFRNIPYVVMLMLVSIAARCQPALCPFQEVQTQAANRDGKQPVVYINTQYGFRFNLPDDWRGFCVVHRQWSAGLEDRGPLLLIRNSAYTDEDPHEDIPIMIFTRNQWKRILQEKLIVSAAPCPPAEIAHNRRYVFCTPPRYFYDGYPGVEEVLAILGSQPMHTFRPKTHTE